MTSGVVLTGALCFLSIATPSWNLSSLAFAVHRHGAQSLQWVKLHTRTLFFSRNAVAHQLSHIEGGRDSGGGIDDEGESAAAACADK